MRYALHELRARIGIFPHAWAHGALLVHPSVPVVLVLLCSQQVTGGLQLYVSRLRVQSLRAADSIVTDLAMEGK